MCQYTKSRCPDIGHRLLFLKLNFQIILLKYISFLTINRSYTYLLTYLSIYPVSVYTVSVFETSRIRQKSAFPYPKVYLQLLNFPPQQLLYHLRLWSECSQVLLVHPHRSHQFFHYPYHNT